MKFRAFLMLAFLVAVSLWTTATPAFAQSGSYVDSLYKASESDEGRSDELTTAAEPDPDVAPAAEPAGTPASSEGEVNFACGQGGCPSLETIIRSIISQIMGASGGGCGGGGFPGRITIIRKPGGCCGTGGGQTGGGQTGGGQTGGGQTGGGQTGGGTTGGANPGDPAEIAALKNEMKSKYGITAEDGQGGAKWSKRQLEEGNKVLATLPPAFRTCTKAMARDVGSDMPRGVLGWVQMGIPRVHMLNASCYQGTFQGTMVHEMTHTFQANNQGATRAFQQQFWPGGRNGGPQPPSVSAYGNTQPVEDMAESVRQYWQAGPQMKQTHPDRYAFIKQNVFGGKEF